VKAGASRDHVGLPEALAADKAQSHGAVGGIEPLTDGLGYVDGKTIGTRSSSFIGSSC
jgi:hypothetical protein